MIRVLLALALLAPSAAALDAFPSETRWGAREATFVVRAAGAIRVNATSGVDVATIETGWHGLPGAVLLRATRPDGRAATIGVADDSGTGVELEWPADAPATAHRTIPFPGWAILAAASAMALLWRAARGAWRSR